MLQSFQALTEFMIGYVRQVLVYLRDDFSCAR